MSPVFYKKIKNRVSNQKEIKVRTKTTHFLPRESNFTSRVKFYLESQILPREIHHTFIILSKIIVVFGIKSYFLPRVEKSIKHFYRNGPFLLIEKMI